MKSFLRAASAVALSSLAPLPCRPDKAPPQRRTCVTGHAPAGPPQRLPAQPPSPTPSTPTHQCAALCVQSCKSIPRPAAHPPVSKATRGSTSVDTRPLIFSRKRAPTLTSALSTWRVRGRRGGAPGHRGTEQWVGRAVCAAGVAPVIPPPPPAPPPAPPLLRPPGRRSCRCHGRGTCRRSEPAQSQTARGWGGR